MRGHSLKPYKPDVAHVAHKTAAACLFSLFLITKRQRNGPTKLMYGFILPELYYRCASGGNTARYTLSLPNRESIPKMYFFPQGAKTFQEYIS